jgi:hypothetical protein
MRLCEWCDRPSEERYCDDVCRRADKAGYITEDTPPRGWPGPQPVELTVEQMDAIDWNPNPQPSMHPRP